MFFLGKFQNKNSHSFEPCIGMRAMIGMHKERHRAAFYAIFFHSAFSPASNDVF